jgi:perosamine synthetase
MKHFIYTSYSPNTRKADLGLNLQILLRPWTWNDTQSVNRLKKWFQTNYNNDEVFTYNYARSALYILLKSLNLPKGTGVLTQTFTCSAATNPIKWASLNPIYVDIDPKNFSMDINNLKKKITPTTKVIIIQHTFGIPGNIDEIVNFAKNHGLYVIEDCAHTILGKTEDGRLLGKISDASIFSLGRDKVVSGVDGGVLIINNKALLQNVIQNSQDLNRPSFIWTLRELLFPIGWWYIKKAFKYRLGKPLHFMFWNLGIIKTATDNTEKYGKKPKYIPQKMSGALAELALNQLKYLEMFNKHRQQISAVYRDKIKSKSVFVQNKNFSLLRQPLLVPNRKGLREFLERNGVNLGDWYTAPITPLKIDLRKYGYIPGSCPNVESVVARIINLPVHINVSVKDAEYISKLINEFDGN